MVSLLLAIVSSAAISVLMRFSETKIKSNLAMLAMNYLMCTALSGVFSGLDILTDLGPLLHITGALGAINGVLYLVSFVLLQANVRKNGVVLSSTFMKLGLLVTMAVSVLFFREVPQLPQVLGFLLAVSAILLINYRKEGSGGTMGLGLVALLLCGGMADAMSKVFEELGPVGYGDPFLLFTFLTALGLCCAVMLLSGQWPGKWEVLFGLAIGIPNFFSTRFLLAALKDLPAVVVYPVYSVGGILLVTLAGLTLFRERLDKRRWIGMAMILAALVLLNI